MSPLAQALFYFAAFILFVLAACNVSAKPNLIAAGLAFWVFVPLVIAFRAAGG